MRVTQSQIVQVQSQIVQTLYMSTAISNCPDTLCEHRNLNLSRHFMWAPQSQTVQVQSQIVQVQSQIVQTLYEGTATSNCPDSNSTTISNCPDTMRALQSQIDETLYDSTAILNCPDTLWERCNFKLFRYSMRALQSQIVHSMRAPQSQIVQIFYESTAISNCPDTLWEHHNLTLSRHSMRAQQSHIVQTLSDHTNLKLSTLYEITVIPNCPDTPWEHRNLNVHGLSGTVPGFDNLMESFQNFQALWRSVETLHTQLF